LRRGIPQILVVAGGSVPARRASLPVSPPVGIALGLITSAVLARTRARIARCHPRAPDRLAVSIVLSLTYLNLIINKLFLISPAPVTNC